MKLLLKLACSMIAIAICVALVIFYITWTFNVTTLNTRTEERLQQIAFNTMDKIDRDFFQRMGDLRAIATDPIISSRESSPQQITERLIAFRDAYKTYSSLSFFDLNRVRVADTSGLSLGMQNSVFQEWDTVLQGNLSIASDVDFSQTLDMPVIFFATLVKDEDNQPFGVLITRVPLSRLYEILGNVSITPAIEENLRIDLVNKDGLSLYSSYNRKGILREKSPVWDAIKDKTQKNIGAMENYQSPGGEESFLVFCREQGYLDFAGNGWTLMIQIPNRVVMAPLIELRKNWLLVVLPSIILAAVVIILLSLGLSKPLTELRDALDEVGKGNLDTRVNIRSRDEIGDFGRYFNNMVEHLKSTTTSVDNLEREITQRKQSEEALRQSEEKFHFLVENSHDIIFTLNTEGVLTFVSSAWTTLLGHPISEVENHPFRLFAHPDELPACMAWMQRVLETGQRQEGFEYRVRHMDGSWRWHTTNAVPLKNEAGIIIGFEGIARDITEQKQLQQKLEEMATHDFLTGLPNRVLLLDHFNLAAALARRNKTMLAVMSLDLDKFKTINDTLGHAIGDRVLQTVGNRFKEVTRASDTIARVGGDEFILLLLENMQKKNAAVIAQKILDSFGEPLFIENHQLQLSTSIGIAIYPEDGEDLDTLVKKSDAALYYSKGHGRSQFKFFSDGDVRISGEQKSAPLT